MQCTGFPWVSMRPWGSPMVHGLTGLTSVQLHIGRGGTPQMSQLCQVTSSAEIWGESQGLVFVHTASLNKDMTWGVDVCWKCKWVCKLICAKSRIFDSSIPHQRRDISISRSEQKWSKDPSFDFLNAGLPGISELRSAFGECQQGQQVGAPGYQVTIPLGLASFGQLHLLQRTCHGLWTQA
jgi:hypothetical protein